MVYKELELPTLYLAFLHVHKSTWGVGCSQPQANTFSFPALSKEAERVLRDLPAQARPISSYVSPRSSCAATSLSGCRGNIV